MTFSDFHKALTSDEYWMDTMATIHRGKDLEQAIRESFGHLIADEDRHKNSTLADCKRLVNSWLTNKRFPKENVKRDLSKL